MITIGLTGMSGSGKTYISKLLISRSITVINTDEIVHDLYREENDCTRLLKTHFGESVLFSDHSVNRKILASIVFADRSKLQLLNEIVHPFVVKAVQVYIESAKLSGEAAIVIEAPQLFEAHLEKEFNYIISVVADDDTRISRISKRDAISREDALRRLSHQHSDLFFKEHSDFIINNSSNDDPEAQLDTILRTIGLHE